MTNTRRILNVLTALVVVSLVGTGAGSGLAVFAQEKPAAPQTPMPATVPQNPVTAPQAPTSAAAQALLDDKYVVGQARPPIVEGSELIELTLDQAVGLALERNLDLKVARMNPISLDYTLQSLRAAYKPNFNGSYSYNNSITPSNSTLEGVVNLTSNSQGYNTGFSQAIKWYGSPSASVSFTNSRSATNNVTTRLNPSWSSRLNFTGSISLMNGFKIDNQRNQWRVFPINREIADITLLNTIETTKNSVRTAYWNLRQAIENIEISRRALELAKKSYSDSLIKVEIGTAAQIDTINFDLSVAQAEQSLLAAQISWQTAELNFKRLLVSGTDDDLYRKTINPIERPALSVATVDIQTAITKTLAEATNLLITRKRLDVSRLNFEVTKQSLLPTVSANGGYNASGQGGVQHVIINGVPTIIDGGYGDAFSNLGGFSNPAWNIGVSVTYRLGQLQEKANVATAQIAIDQAVAQLKAQELSTSTSVINAGLNVNNSYKQYQAAVKSREASEKNADAQQVRFDNGLLTNFEVIQAQNTLTNARLSELRALIAYVNAIAEFERVQKIGG